MLRQEQKQMSLYSILYNKIPENNRGQWGRGDSGDGRLRKNTVCHSSKTIK
nr:hypothetical protein [Sedimentibacter sp.]